MSASVVEAILARVAAALTGATTAGPRVYRARQDAFSAAEMPALNILRDTASHTALAMRSDTVQIGFSVAIYARGADWETQADALHMQLHALLFADAALSVLGRGLRCTETNPQDEEGDEVSGRLTARYVMQVMVRPDDLTKSLS